LGTLERLWPYVVAVGWRIKRIGIVLGDVESSDTPGRQLSFFDVSPSSERECRCQQAVGAIKRRYGRNALIKGIDLLPEANARERNEQIGGHRAW
jgi:DNA polymerase V